MCTNSRIPLLVAELFQLSKNYEESSSVFGGSQLLVNVKLSSVSWGSGQVCSSDFS